MNFKPFLAVLVCFFWISTLNAQTVSIDSVEFYADVMRNAVKSEHKDFAEAKLYELVKSELDSGHLEELKLDSVQWISCMQPIDSSFTLISWMVELNNREARYRNFVVYDNDTYVELIDGGNELLLDGEYAIHSPSETLSAYYYDMIPHYNKSGEVAAYILFGYRNYDKYENVKLIDVIKIEGDELSLGSEIFYSMDENTNQDIKSRLILRYALDSQVSFKYNPNSKMIIFDHLIPRIGRLEGQGPTMLPDGSYEGYFYDKGKWYHKSKLFDQVSEKAPVPQPVLDGKKNTNIFGKSK